MDTYNIEKIYQTIYHFLSLDKKASYREVLQYLFFLDIFYLKKYNYSYCDDIRIKTNEGIFLKNTLYHLLYTFKFKGRYVYNKKYPSFLLAKEDTQNINMIYIKYKYMTKQAYLKICKINKTDKLISLDDILLFWDKAIEEIKKIKYTNNKYKELP